MKNNSPLRTVTWGVRIAAGAAILVAVFWLAAWFAGWTAPWSLAGVITVKTNMALCLLLAGVALLFLRASSSNVWRRACASGLALIVFCVGMLTLSEHLFRYDLGIDQLLAAEAPGAAATASPNRMGLIGATGLALVGAGLFALAWGRRRLAPYFGLAVGVISLFPAVGWLFGGEELFGLPRLTGIAWPTVAALLALGAGLVMCRTESGPMKLLLRDDAGGALLRKMLPAVVLVPLVLGYLSVLSQSRGLVDTSMDAGLLTIAMILIFAHLLWRTASLLSRSAANQAEADRAVRDSEAELKESRNKYRALIESTSDFIWEMDASGRYTYCSPQMEKLWGIKPEAMIGKTPFDMMPEERRDSASASFGDLAKSPQPFSGLELPSCDGQGRLITIEASGVPFFDSAGRLLGFRGITRDITERNRAERALRQSEEYLNFALETSHTGAWDLDLVDHTAFRSLGHDRIFGYAEMLPQWTYEMFLEHVLPEDRAEVDAKFQKATTTGTDWNFECRIRRFDGEIRWIWAAGRHSADAAGSLRRMAGIVQDITERKQAEERLAADLEAMTRLQKLGTLSVHDGNLEPVLAEIVDAAIAVSGADFGNIQLLDPATSDLRIAAHRGFPGWWVDFWNSVSKGRGACGTALKKGERVIVEDVEESPIFAGTPALEIQRRAGVRAVQSTPLVSRTGKTLGMFSTHYRAPRRLDDRTLRLLDLLARHAADIIERARAEQAIRESENQFRVLTENLQSAVALIDDQGRFSIVNRSFLRLFDISVDADIKNVNDRDWSLWQVFDEQGVLLDVDEHPVRRAARTRRPVKDKLVAVRSPARPDLRWMLISAEPILDDQGAVHRLICTYHDITERKKAEALVQALAEQERLRLGAAVEQASDSVVMVDLKGKIKYVNAAFESINRMPREKAVGGSYWELLADEALAGTIRRSVRRGEAWHGHVVRSLAGGRPVELEVTVSPATDLSGKVIGGLITEKDVTIENALQQQVRQAQKMEALGTLAGGITHDFNNILGSVILNTEMALLDLEPSHPARWPLPLVLQAANRGKELVKQIITFSRQRAWERKPLEIAPIVKEGTKFVRSTLPKDATLLETIAPGCGVVLADPSHIHQVLVNLCQNAALAKADKPGQIDLKLAPVEVDPGLAARHPDLKPGPYVRLTVSDNGCGMTPEVMERIFEPFFTTRKHGEGSGLGLAVVHGIVKSYGGAITVYSELGKGSTFSIYFPRLGGEALAQGSAMPLQAAKGRGRILLVEDEEAQRVSMTSGLKRLGYKVTAKADGRSALAAFRRKPDGFDLVITDQIMPKMSGLELAEALVKVKPAVPIILCTGFSEKVNGGTVGQSGVREVVMKPFTLQEVSRAIRRALTQDVPPSRPRS